MRRTSGSMPSGTPSSRTWVDLLSILRVEKTITTLKREREVQVSETLPTSGPCLADS